MTCGCGWAGNAFPALQIFLGFQKLLPFPYVVKRELFSPFIEMKEQRDRQTVHRTVVRALTLDERDLGSD